MPLPEARVDLHELVAAVAVITLELHLREAVEAEGAEQSHRRRDRLVHPHGLPDATRSHAGRRLAQLPAAEQAQHNAVGGDVATDRVQLVIAAGDELLDHRRERLCIRVGAFELHYAVAAERLAAEAAFEAIRIGGLHQDGIADVCGRGPGFFDGGRVRGDGNVDAHLECPLELHALALDQREDVPGGEGVEKPVPQLVAELRQGVHRRIVCGEDRGRQADRVAELAQKDAVRGDVGAGIGGGNGQCVARAEPQGARSVVDRDHWRAHASERADRGETIDERRIGDDCEPSAARGGVRRNAISTQRTPASHRTHSRSGHRELPWARGGTACSISPGGRRRARSRSELPSRRPPRCPERRTSARRVRS